MDQALMIDMLYGAFILVAGFLLRRVFHLFDRIHDEHKDIHGRITDLSNEAVSRAELHGAIDRVLNRIDKLEERLLQK
jgi:uncharacterized coiled-coil DUF342 family protein